MKTFNTPTPGGRHARRLAAALEAFAADPTFANTARQIIAGVDGRGACVGEMTLNRAISEACGILAAGGRVYCLAGSIVYETRGEGRGLVELSSGRRMLPGAPSLLANLFGVAVEGQQGRREYLPPAGLVGAAFAVDALWEKLPEIAYFGSRPTFDRDYTLCRPGWNPGPRILIHGPDIVPALPEPAAELPAAALDRLPPALRELLREFGWAAESDLVNAVAVLLTGLLINQFLDDPHPVAIVDANQPQVGKTLLVQCIGRVLDGVEPPRIALAGDEELEKKLGAHLLSSRSSLVFLDNVRDRIASSVLEQNALSPSVSFRILGRSATVERPNGYLWFVTANGAQATGDFASRAVAIRLHHDGDPSARLFAGDPLGFAQGRRLDILGELAGMVLRWVQEGAPRAAPAHRCGVWSATIGGILQANGLGEFFLANAAEARAEMDQGLLDLEALAERARVARTNGYVAGHGEDPADAGKSASEWVNLLSDAGIIPLPSRETTERSRATSAGRFLAGKVGRSVTIRAHDGDLTLTLRRREERSNRKAYYFAVTPHPAAGGSVSRDEADIAAADGAGGPPGPPGPSLLTPAGEESSPEGRAAPEIDWLN